MSNQTTGNSAHQPREGFMAPTFRIFVRTAEGAEFQAFTWCRDEASGIARAWREGRRWPQRGRRLGGGNLMIDYVTIEIGSGGSTVMVEPELRKGLLAGCSAACWTATLNGPPTMIGGRTTSEPLLRLRLARPSSSMTS